MHIRPVHADDFDAIAALTNVYILQTTIHFGAEPVSGAELGAEWEKSRERHPFVVAHIDGQLAGFAKTTTFRTRAAYARTAEVGVYVHPDFHRRGVARGLYGALLEVCRDGRFEVLVAGIALPNAASVALHEAFGFFPVGVFHRIGFKFGSYHDVGFWELRLA
ncbi:N-acetyltransferase [Deltaproteobacteria bacterium]|nr:N-acetyltransferase [Deltaproteobacteria bacterium]